MLRFCWSQGGFDKCTGAVKKAWLNVGMSPKLKAHILKCLIIADLAYCILIVAM